jgi:ankyrin repeat protein
MNANEKRIKASFQLFDRLKCCLADLNGDFDIVTALALMDEDKMRYFILNCLAALLVVQIERSKHNSSETNKHELVKRKIFAGAISMMMSTECVNNQDQNSIISAFPDDSKMTDERSWLPMHYAVALTVENKISEEDVLILHAVNPLAMHSFSGIGNKGYTPIHLLCMQKRPSVSLVRKMCIRDPQAFVLCDHSGKSALHMVAQYSESLEVLQSILQIDHSLTSKMVDGPYGEIKTTPLGLLCGRSEFPSFQDMVSCLIDIDSTVKVIYDGVDQCIRQYKGSLYQDISPGCRGERTVILLGKLLDANADVAKYSNSNISFTACACLRGELSIAVLTLFLRKNREGIKCINTGLLPIHYAALHSSLDVLKFLLNAYPESLTMVLGQGNLAAGCNLLHLAMRNSSNVPDVKAIMEYLCNLCPALIHMKSSQGETPLNRALLLVRVLNLGAVRVLCNTDASVVRDKCTPTDITSLRSQQLPLHLLITYKPLMKEVSNEGDCFRLFLQLYPASASVKDGRSRSPYDLAVSTGLSVYFIRLLLNADPSIDPVRRHNLNYAARREGLFLAFRALCSSVEPTIWAKLRHEKRDLLKRVISYL